MALLQSPLISDVTRNALSRLMATLIEDIKTAARAQQSTDEALAKGVGDDAA